MGSYEDHTKHYHHTKYICTLHYICSICSPHQDTALYLAATYLSKWKPQPMLTTLLVNSYKTVPGAKASQETLKLLITAFCQVNYEYCYAGWELAPTCYMTQVYSSYSHHKASLDSFSPSVAQILTMICYDVIWCDMIWYAVIWCDVIWCYMMWYDVIGCDMMWYDV